MRVCLLIALVCAVVALTAAQPKPKPRPRRWLFKPRHGCVASRYNCASRFRIGTCRRTTRPNCPRRSPFNRFCRQGTRILRHVHFRHNPFQRPRCCAVANCPVIAFSDCSYKPERCRFGLCTPRFYKLYKLYLICPGRRPFKAVTYRYLPYCCTCRRCPQYPFIRVQ